METIDTKTQKEWRRKWIEALRSGDYKQAQGRLRKGDSYCCLGVLEDISGCEWRPYDERMEAVRLVDGSVEARVDILSGYARKLVGMQTGNGLFYEKFNSANCLSAKNDADASFSEIADIIESEPTGLFE